MNKLEKIERDIQEFSPAELAAFRKWFQEFDAAAWDRQIEEDIQAGVRPYGRDCPKVLRLRDM